jgi:hypothetical protein
MRGVVESVLTDLVLSALCALVLMFAAPFLHEVIGAPVVHPGYLPCWLVLFAVRQSMSLGRERQDAS